MPNLPVLTIAIPTKNRSEFLSENLLQLKKELQGIEPHLIEIIVSDNCSTDDTSAVVNSIVEGGLSVSYLRNSVDIGWGKNFLQCFDVASGMYVLILGDDDFFVDGALSKLMFHLKSSDYGVVCIKTYGFDYSFRAEHPGVGGGQHSYDNPGEFIKDAGALLSLISACVINKQLIRNISLQHDDSPNLPVLHLVLRAAILAKRNLFLKEYLIGCKRNNSAKYNFAEIFVAEMWRIIYFECSAAISNKWIIIFENKMLLEYYPMYLLQIRMNDESATMLNRIFFEKKFGKHALYKYWLRPIFVLPRCLAVPYGVIVTSIGRVLGGDFRRGLHFVKYRLNRLIK